MNDPFTELFIDSPAWHQSAVCASVDPELFFPEKGGSVSSARLLCRGCDVQEQCLEWALDHDEHFGIWAGTSERERIQMRRARKEAS